MARFVGRQGRGALRRLKQQRTIEGEIRNEEYQANKRKAAKAAETEENEDA